MAIIYSYPLTTPHLEDLLIGTVTFNELDPLSPRNNPTVSFTVQSLVDMIGPIIGVPNLEQVTNQGATANVTVTLNGGVSVPGFFKDSSEDFAVVESAPCCFFNPPLKTCFVVAGFPDLL